jgi:DNA mismatch endonuclease, patch repair protein
MDRVDKEIRHRIMSANKSKNSSIEIEVRKALLGKGFRYKLHAKDIPGKPDIVFPTFKVVIFVHGCFWHGHECERQPKSKSNLPFWRQKISKNKERDLATRNILLNLKWRILIIWECAIRRQNPAFASSNFLDKTVKWIKGNGRLAIISESGFEHIL